MYRVLIPALVFLMGSAQALIPTTAEAAIYKCTGDDGGVTYTHTPCADSQTTSKVLKSSGNSNNGADCRIANTFALDVAEKMREGRSADSVFSEYGGIDALRPTTISIINYVYTHRLNVSTVPARIAQLSAARCDASAYGNPTCDQFPLPYIKEAGGCDAAVNGVASVSATTQAMQEDLHHSDDMSPDLGGPPATLAAVRAAPPVVNPNTGQDPTECKRIIDAKMASVRESMRARLSADQQNKLREDYNSLRASKKDC
jgi:hypothetical protein